MGKVKSCSISLTKPSLVYRPGDSVSGTATVEIEGQLKVRTVRVVCKGQALTKWARFMQKAFESDYESTEVYCNTYVDVYTASPPALMETGVYMYTFNFKLPREGIPSSFEGSLGAIRYWITVEVDKPFPSINDRFYRSFTVLANIDINEAIYRRPAGVSAQKLLSKVLGIGNVGTLTASLSLDRSGYCPGEQICINLEAKNDSTKDLGLVKTSLVQTINYKAAESTDCTTRVIRTVHSDKLGKGQSVKWTDQMMAVDLVPPSSKSLTCHIIKVSYMVKVEIEVPLGLDLEIRIPITIGTVPRGVSLPSQPERVGVTDNSTSVGYALCTAGYQNFCKTTSGFPNLSYIPRTVIVNVINQQPPARNHNSAAATLSPATDAQPVVYKSNIPVAVASSPIPQVTESLYSKAAETNQQVSAVVDVSHLTIPPTYEEACANMIPQILVLQYTPLAPGNGCILVLLFPCLDTALVGPAFKRATPNLLLHKGRVLAFTPEIRLLPSQQTAAVLIRFGSERAGLSWLQNMTYSNTELSSRWHAMIGENKKPNDYIGDAEMCTYMSVKLFKYRADFKHSRSYWDEYKLLLNQALVPAKEKHGARTLVSGKVIYACGDWSSFPSKASELILVVSGFPNRESHEAFLQESDNNREIVRFHELFMMYCSCLFKVDIDIGDIGKFQDLSGKHLS